MFVRLSQTFRMVPSLTSYSRPNACSFGLLNFVTNITLLGSGQAGSLKFHAFPIANHRIKRSRKQYE